MASPNLLPAELPPAELALHVSTAWARYLSQSARSNTPHPSIYASAWRVCDRRMAYELTQPAALPPWSPEVLARFRRGDDRERDLLADLARIGRDAEPAFSVTGQQERFELRDRKGRIAITGKVDARLLFDRTTRPPLEVKAWSPFVVDRIERFEDLFENPWTIAGAHQLLAYLYGAGEPYGFLLLDRSGLPLLLPVELDHHLDRMEAFLSKAEAVIDHVAAGTLPPFLDDPSECRRCPWFGHTCNPPLSTTGAQILTDPELEAQLERREALQTTGREYLDLDRTIKGKLRGVESGIVGKFQITGTWGKQSTLELPAELKRQYTRTDPKGRFTLHVEKVIG